MIAFFASAGAPSAALLGELAATAALGVAWGWAAGRLRAAYDKPSNGGSRRSEA